MKIFLFIFIGLNIKIAYCQDYKYCQLIGVQKILGFKIKVFVDSGQVGGWGMDFAVKDTVEVEEIPEYRNEKMYVNTDANLYEGKQVLSDAKGKFIWHKVQVSKPATPTVKVKNKSFNSMIDGMNYMGDRGWEFVQAYVITHGNQNVYHYVLKKKTQ